MDSGQAAFVELSDGYGATFARWQNYWVDAITTWEGQPWAYQQFDWEGITSGQAVGDQATLTLPAVPSVLELTNRALAGSWVVQLRVLQFDEEVATTAPPATYVLAASCIGQVVGASGNLTQRTWRLGSALAPLGAQFPPRSALTSMIGVPCRL